MEERTWETVYLGKYKGRNIVVLCAHWNLPDEMKYKFPDLVDDYYCGYVRLYPNDYYDTHREEAEEELDVFGGITYDRVGNPTRFELAGGHFIGFDTAHAYQPPFTEETVICDCKGLVNQINAKNQEVWEHE